MRHGYHHSNTDHGKADHPQTRHQKRKIHHIAARSMLSKSCSHTRKHDREPSTKIKAEQESMLTAAQQGADTEQGHAGFEQRSKPYRPVTPMSAGHNIRLLYGLSHRSKVSQ